MDAYNVKIKDSVVYANKVTLFNMIKQPTKLNARSAQITAFLVILINTTTQRHNAQFAIITLNSITLQEIANLIIVHYILLVITLIHMLSSAIHALQVANNVRTIWNAINAQRQMEV